MAVGCARLGPQMGRGQEGVGQLVQGAGRHAPRPAPGSALRAPEQVFLIGRQLEPGFLKFFRLFPGLETLVAFAMRPEVCPGKLPVRFAATGAENDGHRFLLFRRFRLRARKKQRCGESARYCGGENAGKHGIDTGRALYGQTVWGDTIGGLGVWGQMSGAFTSTGDKISRPVRSYPVTEQLYDAFLRFDAATLWGDHAGNEFTPEHYRQPVALYLGSPAEV